MPRKNGQDVQQLEMTPLPESAAGPEVRTRPILAALVSGDTGVAGEAQGEAWDLRWMDPGAPGGSVMPAEPVGVVPRDTEWSPL
ncbi:hypothetical protein NDU88_002180 [Pleurodeles waltl]|uniref:Uncharacterized protein n=1 Tax=Pleurodeles waltl TaxID=8319 RepID=A0AAV7TJW2_PLEWA|nr:hypothetical protein NDU88_002180 [Pleurodeles waltl]